MIEDDGTTFFASKGDVHIYLTLFYENDGEDKTEAVMCIYKNKQNTLNYGGTIVDVFEKFKQEIKSL